MTEWHVILPYLILVSEWGIRLILAPVVIRRHHAAEALAWLAIVFFQPYAGLAVYLIVGRAPLARDRMSRHVRARTQMASLDLSGRLAPFVVPTERIAPHRRDLVRLVERLGHMPLVGGNDVRLITDTAEVIDELIGQIDAAEESVHLLFYIFRDDATGRRVAESLRRAAGRGVACRVLIDDVGSRDARKRLAPSMRAAGVDVRAAMPVHLLRRSLQRIDVRNHRKLAVIDGRVALTGSQNITNPDYGQGRVGPWRDMTMRLSGPVVQQVQNVFAEDWCFETGVTLDAGVFGPAPAEQGDVAAQTIPSGPGYSAEAFRDLLVDAVHEADHRVVMTTPYLVPDEPFLLALRLAAMGGVRVDVVVPERGNHPLVQAAAGAYFDTLMEAGVNIWLHRSGLLHAKTVSIDESMSMIGSGNFDRRSFSLNFELNLMFVGRAVTRRLREHQQAYIGESRALDPEAWARRSASRKLLQHSAKLFGPLL